MPSEKPDMNVAQEAKIGILNDAYDVNRWEIRDDGTVFVTFMDGDTTTIAEDGTASPIDLS